jgi:hypothetical protein
VKKEFTDEFGHHWTFTKWRIEPPGHILPSGRFIPPEALFTNEEGLTIGFHPEGPDVRDDVRDSRGKKNQKLNPLG